MTHLERNAQILHAVLSGEKQKDVGARFGISQHAVSQIISRMNVKLAPQSSKYDKKTKTTVLNLANGTRTLSEIAVKLNCTENEIRNIFRVLRHEGHTPHIKRESYNQRPLSEQDAVALQEAMDVYHSFKGRGISSRNAEIIQARLEGELRKEVANRFDLTPRQITDITRRVVKRQRRART